jgi:hypothetical protein
LSEAREIRGEAEPRDRRDAWWAGSERVGQLLFEWETRGLSPVRRVLMTGLLRARRAVSAASLGMMLFVLGAAVSVALGSVVHDEPVRGPLTAPLLQRLQEAEDALLAREGELELARLEMGRLTSIIDQSRRHRIPADLSAAIHDIAISEGIDPALAYSLVRVESGFAQHAVSSAGAVGLAQLMPSTAFWLQPGITRPELFDRETNLRLGFRYLKLMLEQYNGDLHLALLAYNRGPGRVDDILRAGGDPSNGYSRLVRSGSERRPSE